MKHHVNHSDEASCEPTGSKIAHQKSKSLLIINYNGSKFHCGQRKKHLLILAENGSCTRLRWLKLLEKKPHISVF